MKESISQFVIQESSRAAILIFGECRLLSVLRRSPWLHSDFRFANESSWLVILRYDFHH